MCVCIIHITLLLQADIHTDLGQPDTSLRYLHIMNTSMADEETDDLDASLQVLSKELGVSRSRGRWVSEDASRVGPIQELLVSDEGDRIAKRDFGVSASGVTNHYQVATTDIEGPPDNEEPHMSEHGISAGSAGSSLVGGLFLPRT